VGRRSAWSALALVVALSVGCGSASDPLPPRPTPSPTPGAASNSPATGACGGLELHPLNRHYFRDKASGRPVLIVGYRNLTPGFAPFVPTAPPGQPQPPGAGTQNPDPRFTDYVLDDMTGQPGPFGFPSFKRYYVTVVHLGAGNDPLLDPMYDSGTASPYAPTFYVWPWLRGGAGDACYGSFGDPRRSRYDVGGNGTCPAAWNDAYFDRLSDAVRRASDSCITSEVKIFDKSMLLNHWRNVPWAADNSSNGMELPACTEPGGWSRSFYLQRPAPNLQRSQQCYVDRILEATRAATNVVYEIENENDTRGTEPWARTWAQHIKERTPHLVSYSSLWDENTAAALADPAIDIVNLHFGEQLERERGRPRNFITRNWNVGASSIDGVVGAGKPVNVDEFGKCHGTAAGAAGATYDTLRKMAWAIVAAGGHFHIEDACDPLITAPGQTPVTIDARPREVVENIRRFVEDSGLPDGGWNFLMSEPFPAPPAPGASPPAQVQGRFCMGPDAAIFAASPEAGPRDYLCYFDGSDGSARKTIEGIEAASYSAVWWDPRNGGLAGPGIDIGCVIDETVTVSAPDAADWVLLLRKVRDC
jgi:hypothetical protein